MLNILLAEKTPISKAGSSCVQLVCIPNPPLDPKSPSNEPAVMLIRVKTNGDAEELFDNLEKYKKGIQKKQASIEEEEEEHYGIDEEEENLDDEDYDEDQEDSNDGPHSENDEDGDIQCLD